MKVELCASNLPRVLLLGLHLGCSKEAPPAGEQPRSPVVAAATPEQSPAAASAKPAEPAAGTRLAVAGGAAPAEPAAAGANQVSEANFELKISPKGAYEAGKPAEAEIVLDAKPPFHVNDKYPYKFKLKEAPGLTFPAPVVTKDAAKLDKARVTMTVAFTPAAGKHDLSGQFAFSVCTDDKCLIEKRDLSLAVDAK
jgi:hypothetical protein